MKKSQRIEYPFVRRQVRRLRVGDRVLVSGRIFTGRDRLHRYLAGGGKAPLKLKAGAIFHCGPVVIRAKDRWVVRAAGPTTSIREEPYMAEVIRRHGLTVIIGKGGLGAATRTASKKYGCVYLHAIGGAAQVLADKIERVEGVYFLDKFGAAEAMWVLAVRDFPAVVTMDAQGRSLHAAVAAQAEKNLRKLSSHGLNRQI
jgi:fumarate hydratase class I